MKKFLSKLTPDERLYGAYFVGGPILFLCIVALVKIGDGANSQPVVRTTQIEEVAPPVNTEPRKVETIVANPDPTATCEHASKFSSGCSPAQQQASIDAYWAQQNDREAELRADCRAGKIDRSTCNRLVWDWETRI